MLDFIYHLSLKLIWNHMVDVKTLRIWHCVHSVVIYIITKSYLQTMQNINFNTMRYISPRQVVIY